MTDIFNNTILCGKCEVKMNPIKILKNGFVLRAVMCPKCHSKTIHPKDEQEYKDFIELKKKEYNVKMRFVGNSYAVSIPKEIVRFMKEQEKIMNDMVRLSFEEFGRISLNFGNQNLDEIEERKQRKDKLKKQKYH
jgi:ribosomal protein L40E